MDRESPEVAAFGIRVQGFEEARRPIDVVAIGADSHEAKRVAITWNPGCVAAVCSCVLFRRHVAATTPALVADSPEVDVEGFAVAIRGAQGGESIGLGGSGGV
jgi:hypothetical protein